MLISGQLHRNTEEAVYETDSIRVRATRCRRKRNVRAQVSPDCSDVLLDSNAPVRLLLQDPY